VPNFVTADFAQNTSFEVAQAKVEVSRLVKPSRHQTWLGNPRTKWRFIDGTIIELNGDFLSLFSLLLSL